MQLAFSFAFTVVLVSSCFLSFTWKKSFRHLLLLDMNNSDHHNNHIDNRSSSDGRKQSPPAFLDLADSVSAIGHHQLLSGA